MRTEPLRAQLLAELAHLTDILPELRGCLVASTDGLLIAADGLAQAHAHTAEGVAALSAAAVGLSQRITEVTGQETFSELTIRSSGGYLAMYLAGGETVLVLIAETLANLARMNLEARRSITRIAAIVGEAESFAQSLHAQSPPAETLPPETLPARSLHAHSPAAETVPATAVAPRRALR